MSKVISHVIDPHSGGAVITLQDDLGARRLLHVNITNQQCTCCACGRALPMNGSAVDVAALITAELASMDAAVAKLHAYAAAHNLPVPTKG